MTIKGSYSIMLFNFVEYIIHASLYVIFSYLYFIFCLFLFLVYHPTLGYGVPFPARIFIFIFKEMLQHPSHVVLKHSSHVVQ